MIKCHDITIYKKSNPVSADSPALLGARSSAATEVAKSGQDDVLGMYAQRDVTQSHSFQPITTQLSFVWRLCYRWINNLHKHYIALQWRHNQRNGVSNRQRLDGLLNRLFERRSKKTSKLCVTGFCEGNSPVTGEFPQQRANNAENVSIWRRNHGKTRSNGLHSKKAVRQMNTFSIHFEQNFLNTLTQMNTFKTIEVLNICPNVLKY